mmetsp:Transcript_18893/g.34200  ORF Transcript_18893/g.34200 Transcript_18893/m.34200 type:complete len:854 (+) Transcript_18893:5579-8140(+)
MDSKGSRRHARGKRKVNYKVKQPGQNDKKTESRNRELLQQEGREAGVVLEYSESANPISEAPVDTRPVAEESKGSEEVKGGDVEVEATSSQLHQRISESEEQQGQPTHSIPFEVCEELQEEQGRTEQVSNQTQKEPKSPFNIVITAHENPTPSLDGFEVTFKPKKPVVEEVKMQTLSTDNLEEVFEPELPRSSSGIGTWYDAEFAPDSASDVNESRSFESEETEKTPELIETTGEVKAAPAGEGNPELHQDGTNQVLDSIEIPTVNRISLEERLELERKIAEDDLKNCIKVIDLPHSEVSKSEYVNSSESEIIVHDQSYSEVPEEEPPQPNAFVPQPTPEYVPERISERNSRQSSMGEFNSSLRDLISDPKVETSSVESLLDKISPISSRGSLRVGSSQPYNSAVELLTSELWKRKGEGNTSNLSSHRQQTVQSNESHITGPLQLKDLTSMSERHKANLLDDLRIAAKCINVKVIKAMMLAPTDIVIELGMGLMYICDMDVPQFNHREAVQRFYSKPGFVIQKVRALEKEILELNIPTSAMSKLAGILSELTENKVRSRDSTGVAHIMHYFLTKALGLFQSCQSKLLIPRLELSKMSSSSMPVSPKNTQFSGLLTPGNSTAKSMAVTPSKPSKLQLSAKIERSSRTSLQPSNRSKSKSSPRPSPLKKSESQPKLVPKINLLTAGEAFESANPKVIEKYLEKEHHDLINLVGTRKKAEWNALRRHKLKLHSQDAQLKAAEIEYAAKLSQKQHELALQKHNAESKVKHDALKEKASYLRNHKKEVSLRSKPYYSRSANFKSQALQDSGPLSEEQLMNAYEDMIVQQERICSMRYAYQEIQDQKRAEQSLLNKFFS